MRPTTVNLEALLSNEFVVLALDALLHVASVIVLSFVVVLASKLLTKAHVDTKLVTSLFIAVVLVFTRVFLLNNAHYLGPVDVLIVMVLVAIVLFLTAFILVYKLMAIPVIGTTLSSIAIVAAQLTLAHYTPILSLKLLPEGQRFAEYAGIANERTKQLMDEAEALQNQGDGIKVILQRALASLAFFTSKSEQDVLAKDFSQGMEFLRARKEYMDSLSEEELAEYRAAMAEFLQEQGLAGAESRYSLSNLKDASPEDLENLADFMKDMNRAYGFTDDLPESEENEALPPTAESLRQITQNLKGIDLRNEQNDELLGKMLEFFGDDAFKAEMSKVRGQLSDLQANSGKLMETLGAVDLDGMRQDLESASGQVSRLKGINLNPDVPSYPKYGDLPVDRGQRVAVNFGGSESSIFDSGGSAFVSSSEPSSNDQELLDVVRFQETGQFMEYEATIDTGSAPPGRLDSKNEPEEISYYMPGSQLSAFPEPAEQPSSPAAIPSADIAVEPSTPKVVETNFFEDSELVTRLTDTYVLKVPSASDESALWTEAAKTIRVDTWFEGTSPDNRGTVFLDGVAYRADDEIIRTHNGEIFRFRFEGVLDGQVVITSLKRETP